MKLIQLFALAAIGLALGACSSKESSTPTTTSPSTGAYVAPSK